MSLRHLINESLKVLKFDSVFIVALCFFFCLFFYFVGYFWVQNRNVDVLHNWHVQLTNRVTLSQHDVKIYFCLISTLLPMRPYGPHGAACSNDALFFFFFARYLLRLRLNVLFWWNLMRCNTMIIDLIPKDISSHLDWLFGNKKTKKKWKKEEKRKGERLKRVNVKIFFGVCSYLLQIGHVRGGY